MSRLPDTTTPKPHRRPSRPWRIPTVIAVVAVAGALFVSLLPSGGKNFPVGEEMRAPGVEEISASTGDAPFPRSDASRFGAGTEAVRVYLRVEDLPPRAAMAATVERSGRSSVFSRLLRTGGVVADGGGEERLSVSGNGVSGVVSFVVKGARGGALPAGEYGVKVRLDSGGKDGGGRTVARKYFAVGDRQD